MCLLPRGSTSPCPEQTTVPSSRHQASAIRCWDRSEERSWSSDSIASPLQRAGHSWNSTRYWKTTKDLITGPGIASIPGVPGSAVRECRSGRQLGNGDRPGCPGLVDGGWMSWDVVTAFADDGQRNSWTLGGGLRPDTDSPKHISRARLPVGIPAQLPSPVRRAQPGWTAHQHDVRWWDGSGRPGVRRSHGSVFLKHPGCIGAPRPTVGQ